MKAVDDGLESVLGLDHHAGGLLRVCRFGCLCRLDLLVDGLEEEAEDTLEEFA